MDPLNGNSQVRVSVILATYNGEKHITAQLQSLADQTFEDLTIYIRDDGSTDRTVQTIQQFIAEYSGNKKFVLMESDKNLGVPASFYEILRQCPQADFYAFCDQDDLWYPDKMARAVNMLLDGYSPEVPTIYFSRSRYQDENGEVLRDSAHQKLPILLNKVIYHTPASGFTCVFNEALKQKMIIEHDPGKELHDRYMIRGAVCFGKTVYDDACTAAHIRHTNAVTSGDSSQMSLLIHFIKKELFGSLIQREKEGIKWFYQAFKDEILEDDRKLLALFSSERHGIGIWFRKVFYPHKLRSSLPGEIALRFLFFINRV